MLVNTIKTELTPVELRQSFNDSELNLENRLTCVNFCRLLDNRFEYRKVVAKYFYDNEDQVLKHFGDFELWSIRHTDARSVAIFCIGFELSRLALGELRARFNTYGFYVQLIQILPK